MAGNCGEWREIRLGEVVELKRGFDLPQQERQPGRVPIVSSSGPNGVHSRAMVKAPGVVTGRYGTLGQVFFVEEDFWPLNTTLYVRDFKGNDPRFVAFLLRTVDFLSCSDKAAVPGVNRNHLHELPIRVPSRVEDQRAIAGVLGALDDKIDLNRRMNQTLESMAQALFRSWFVDFDPVRTKAEGRKPVGMDAETAALFPHELERDGESARPVGWALMALDEAAGFLNGLALQKFPAKDDNFLPVLKIAQLRQGDTKGADKASVHIPPEYIVNDGDVLFSWSGSLLVSMWAGGRAALNQHLFKVSSLQFPKWFYFFWCREHLPDFQRIAEGKATTMGHIQRHHLSQAKVVVPDTPMIHAADKLLSPLLGRWLQNALESRNLAQLRDLLLPKLLSGEIRVKDAERAAAAGGDARDVLAAAAERRA